MKQEIRVFDFAEIGVQGGADQMDTDMLENYCDKSQQAYEAHT